MFFDSKPRYTRVVNRIRPLAVALALLISALTASAQEIDITKKLDGFDSYMAQILKDWNTPGIGVGIVVNDKLVFAKGSATATTKKSSPSRPPRFNRSHQTPSSSPQSLPACWSKKANSRGTSPFANPFPPSSSITISSTTTSPCATCSPTAPELLATTSS